MLEAECQLQLVSCWPGLAEAEKLGAVPADHRFVCRYEATVQIRVAAVAALNRWRMLDVPAPRPLVQQPRPPQQLGAQLLPDVV